MNSDLRISTNLVNHPKVKRLMLILGPESFYSLISLWSYAAINKPDGNLTGLDEIDIQIASNWSGDSGLFFDTLCKLKFIDCTDDSTVIHDWVDNNPYASSAVKRSNKATFSNLKKWHKEKAEVLQGLGIVELTRAEFNEVIEAESLEDWATYRYRVGDRSHTESSISILHNTPTTPNSPLPENNKLTLEPNPQLILENEKHVDLATGEVPF